MQKLNNILMKFFSSWVVPPFSKKIGVFIAPQYLTRRMDGKSAAGFVIFKKICEAVQYLLLQTSYGEHHWTPPKGHVDPGETEMATAIRETKEESGLSEDDLKIHENSVKVLNYQVNGKPKKVTYWLAELVNPDAEVKLSDEHQDFKWLTLEDACSYGRYGDLQEMLRYYDDYIKSTL